MRPVESTVDLGTSDVRGQARRSILLTGLSYPLFIAGIVLLFTTMTVPAAVLLGSGVFLIGINELCIYIARSSLEQHDIRT